MFVTCLQTIGCFPPVSIYLSTSFLSWVCLGKYTSVTKFESLNKHSCKDQLIVIKI